MKKIRFYLLVVFLLNGIITFGQFAGGSGTEADPWQIQTLAQLDSVRNHASDHFILMNDLDFDGSSYDIDNGGIGWTPIGTSNNLFKGTFDGDNYEIKNMDINMNQDYCGLFGYVVYGKIQNLHLENCYVYNTQSYSGALCGILRYSTVQGCSVNGTIMAGDYMGGLIGYVYHSTVSECNANMISEPSQSTNIEMGGLIGEVCYGDISKCYAIGSIGSAYWYVGGLIGRTNNDVSVSECYSNVTISTIRTGYYVGGLLGYLSGSCTIENCYTSGSISGGASYVGGIIGFTYYTDVSLTNTYTVCSVSGNVMVGPMAGYGGKSGYVTLNSCYYSSEITGINRASAGGEINGTDLSLSQFKQQNSFNSFNFTSVWTISEGISFPRLLQVNNVVSILPFTEQIVAKGDTFKDTVHVIATGDDQDLIFELEDAPDGMTISDSIITWNTDKSGEFNFKVKITDGMDNCTSYDYVIKVYSFKQAGTIDDPYQITTIDELSQVGFLLEGYYILMNDLDFSESIFSDSSWEPIGTQHEPFTGNFNGKGHTISNLFVDHSDANYQGLFGYCRNVVIDSLAVVDCEVKGYNYLGGISGYLYNSKISNCYVTGSIKGNQMVGGLVGYIYNGSTINKCYSSTSVSAESVGGNLCGQAYYATIENCYGTGSLLGSSSLGGILGYDYGSTITNCYAAAYVNKGQYTGAVIGYGTSSTTIENTYYNNDVSQSVSGSGVGVSINGSIGELSNTEMEQQSNYSSWDFTDIWTISNGETFPRLQSVYNYPVVLYSISPYATIKKLYTDTITVIPMDNLSLTYSLQNLPDGMSIADNIISWTPDNDSTFSFQFCAIDGNSARTIMNFDIVVVPFTGQGTEESPFQITTIEDLDYMHNALGCSYELMNDLDFTDSKYDTLNSENGWEPVGTNGSGFTGSFNGKGYRISNMCSFYTGYTGFFGYCHGAKIDSVNIINCYFNANSHVGALAGFAENCSISNCYSTGQVNAISDGGGLVGWFTNCEMSNCGSNVNVKGTGTFLGGLVGIAYQNSISNCFATGNVEGIDQVGGLVGQTSYLSKVANCFATGKVYGASRAGGLIGYNDHCDYITACYATGDVYADDYAGGCIGYSKTDGNDSVTSCFAAGYTDGENDFGGFLGLKNSTVFVDCYFDSLTTHLNYGVGNDPASDEITAMSTTQMKQQGSFGSWDFDSIWGIKANTTYPALQSLNNAPFAFSDTVDGSLSKLFKKNYDFETGKEKLVYKYIKVISLVDSVEYTDSVNTIEIEDSLYMEYRIGELLDYKDTLWGNSVISYLKYYNTAPVITSTAPVTAISFEEYSYEVIATDAEGDQLYYSLENEPEGMYMEGNTIYWIPGEDVTTSGEVTVIVSDGFYTDSEMFTIEVEQVEEQSNIHDNDNSDDTHFYPNPVKDMLYITSGESINRIEIVSLTGEVVLADNVNHLEKQLNLSSLNDGLYIVILYCDEGIKTQRILKN